MKHTVFLFIIITLFNCTVNNQEPTTAKSCMQTVLLSYYCISEYTEVFTEDDCFNNNGVILKNCSSIVDSCDNDVHSDTLFAFIDAGPDTIRYISNMVPFYEEMHTVLDTTESFSCERIYTED